MRAGDRVAQVQGMAGAEKTERTERTERKGREEGDEGEMLPVTAPLFIARLPLMISCAPVCSVIRRVRLVEVEAV